VFHAKKIPTSSGFSSIQKPICADFIGKTVFSNGPGHKFAAAKGLEHSSNDSNRTTL
jgi:hypothetical protein